MVFDGGDELLYIAEAVQQGVGGVDMQVDKGHGLSLTNKLQGGVDSL